MKIQWSKRASSFLLVFVLLVGSGSVSGIHSSAFANAPASIDSREAKSTFESKDFISINTELDKIRLDKKALDDNSIIREVVSLYDGINKISLSKSEKVALKMKIIRVLVKARVPLSTETLERISLTDKNPYIRHQAKDWLAYKRRSTISMQIDTSRYILVDGKGMTYAEAYPILVKKVESSSIEQKIDGVKLLARYDHRLKDKPVIDKLIDLYHAMSEVPNMPYREYSDTQKKNLTLKGEILIALASSENSKGKDLLNKAKYSSNRYIRGAVGKIEKALISTSTPSNETPTNNNKAKTFYVILGKAVPKQEALALIKKALQTNSGDEIKDLTGDISRAPSLIKGTDVFVSLSKFLIQIALNGVPSKWNLSPREIYFIKNQTFDSLVNSGDSRIPNTIKKLEASTDPDIKYFVEHYRRDNAK